jgi:hypothetical protein
MSTPQKDPLRALGSRVLRQIARHLKIKHYYRKSPSKLRRAIARDCSQRHPESAAVEIQRLINRFTAEAADTQTPPTLAVKPGKTPAKASAPADKASAPVKNIRALEEVVENRQAAERKAIEEHRLRYLFSPSQFVHKGTHEAFILEKDEDIELPDYYAENELVALPIDPYRFYVYWDFDTARQVEVEGLLAQAPDVFMLKISDVTGIVYNGSNAHSSTLEPCNPLIKEWYLNTQQHDRNLCIELGYRHAQGFEVLLRSNTVYIPPATVSPIRQDQFAQFVPSQPVPTDRLMADTQRPLVLPASDRENAAAESLVGAFFETYQPTPIQFNPLPPARPVSAPASPPQPAFVPEASQAAAAAAAAANTAPAPHPVVNWRPAPSRAVFLKPPEAPRTDSMRVEPPVAPPQAQAGTHGLSTEETESWLSEAGGHEIKNWLGLPYDVRWFSDFPTDALPMMFEQWITDPYDQALMISYAIWPWEITEYLPLGASDGMLQKFLGASLFSWVRQAGSERMVRWQTQPGGSEQIHWLRPQGASEQYWSGSLQPQRQQQIHPWESWPPAPPAALSLASGSGFFRA